MKIIFFSDAHLDRKDDGKTLILQRFIADVCSDADMVVILGDMFEFYHGYEGFIYQWYKEAVDAMKSLTSQGKIAYFIEGNHEFRMGRFFESYTGIGCMESLTLNIDGKKVFAAHGYQTKTNYLVKFLKTRFVYFVMDVFGPDLTWNIAALAKIVLSRKKKPYSTEAVDAFRKYARQKFDQGYDAVVLAHSHICDCMEYTSDGTKKYYLNTGDIIESLSYVEYNTDRGFEVRKYAQT